MIEFELKDQSYIDLTQLLKATDLVSSGGEAHIRIERGEVWVNDMVENRKRKKCRKGDIILLGKDKVVIT